MKKKQSRKTRKTRNVINLQVAPNITAVETRVAAKAVFFDDYARVLLIRERQDGGGTGTNPGLWDVPGGTVKSDETLSEALARELVEEIGVESLLQFKKSNGSEQLILPNPVVMQKDPKKTRLYFPVLLKAEGFRIALGGDFEEWAFVGVESILCGLYELVPGLSDVILKLMIKNFSLKAIKRNS